jgi:hypothetical protein
MRWMPIAYGGQGSRKSLYRYRFNNHATDFNNQATDTPDGMLPGGPAARKHVVPRLPHNHPRYWVFRTVLGWAEECGRIEG